MNQYDLPEMLASVLITQELNSEFSHDLTMDDFLDVAGIEKEDRIDGALIPLVEQALFLVRNTKY